MMDDAEMAERVSKLSLVLVNALPDDGVAGDVILNTLLSMAGAVLVDFAANPEHAREGVRTAGAFLARYVERALEGEAAQRRN